MAEVSWGAADASELADLAASVENMLVVGLDAAAATAVGAALIAGAGATGATLMATAEAVPGS